VIEGWLESSDLTRLEFDPEFCDDSGDDSFESSHSASCRAIAAAAFYIWINETRCTVNITSILTQLKRWTS
jgi:hypothetical protein